MIRMKYSDKSFYIAFMQTAEELVGKSVQWNDGIFKRPPQVELVTGVVERVYFQKSAVVRFYTGERRTIDGHWRAVVRTGNTVTNNLAADLLSVKIR